MLPSSIEFPAQSLTVSHPIGVDADLENYACQVLTQVQHTSTHNPAITSPDEPLNWPRLVLMAKGSASINDLGQSVPTDSFHGNNKKSVGYPPLGTHSIPKGGLSKRGGGSTNGIL